MKWVNFVLKLNVSYVIMGLRGKTGEYIEKRMNEARKKNNVTPRRYKQYHELDFTDNFMFCKILEKKPDLCRRLLETILNKKIRKIVFVNTEEAISLTSDGKGIRLDVYVDDENGTVYDMEMQTTSNQNLPKRSRYYQGMIDLNLIEKGEDYLALKESYVIFICTFDFFNRGIPVYTFTNRCKELSDLELGDETVKIFINPYGDSVELSEDMDAFLKYLAGDKNQENDLVKEIEDEVNTARDQKEWRVEYMTLFLRDQENYRTGKAEGKAEDILELLEECGSVSETLKEVIYSQNDLEVLKKWFKIAMRVSTVEEFVERISTEKVE